MSQFYTKEQTDQLATIIGQRIKASVSTNSVTAALLESDKYVLLTKAEKASLATGNIRPAANNDSFLDALDNGYTAPVTDAQYMTLDIPTQQPVEMVPMDPNTPR